MSKIDINRADVEALAQLNGIGTKLAARIITYRETVHPFEETIELTAVPGISERMVRALADEIMVEPVSALAETDPSLAEEETPAEVIITALPEASPGSGGEATGTIPPAEEDEPEPVAAPAEMAPVEAVEAEEVPEETDPEGETGEKETPAEVDVILLPEETPGTGKRAEAAGSTPLAEATGTLPTADLDAEAEPLATESPEEEPVGEESPAIASLPPRTGCLNSLLIALLGALLGAGLTLLLLLALNGTLDFATPAQVAGLRGQIEAQNEEQSGLDEEVAVLSTRVSGAISAEATTAADLEEIANNLERDLAGLERELADDVATLEAETVSLANRIAALSDATANFDLFLDGMRDLLIDLRGLPPLPEATTTPTPAAAETVTGTVAAGTPPAAETPPADETPSAEGTPSLEGTPTPTPFVTRTPRPTATPLVSPTPTSVNIP